IGAKGNPSDETRYAKVQIVSEYIEKHLDVGSIDAPSTYLKGSLSMWWAPTFLGKSAVYFGGHTERTCLGLGGSTIHLIGRNENSRIYFSSLPDLLCVLQREEKVLLFDRKTDDQSVELRALEA